MDAAEEIKKRIQELQKDIDWIMTNEASHGKTPAKLLQKQSEIFVAASQLAEISTQRVVELTGDLVSLTKALKLLTIALVVVAVVTLIVMLKQDFSANPQHIQAGQYHQTPSNEQTPPAH